MSGKQNVHRLLEVGSYLITLIIATYALSFAHDRATCKCNWKPGSCWGMVPPTLPFSPIRRQLSSVLLLSPTTVTVGRKRVVAAAIVHDTGQFSATDPSFFPTIDRDTVRMMVTAASFDNGHNAVALHIPGFVNGHALSSLRRQ